MAWSIKEMEAGTYNVRDFKSDDTKVYTSKKGTKEKFEDVLRNYKDFDEIAVIEAGDKSGLNAAVVNGAEVIVIKDRQYWYNKYCDAWLDVRDKDNIFFTAD